METAIFPQENDRRVDAQTMQKIEEAKKRNFDHVRTIETQTPTYPKSPDGTQEVTIGMGCLLHIILAFSLCFWYNSKEGFSSIVAGLLSSFVVTTPLILIGIFGVNYIIKKSYKNRMQVYLEEQNAIKNRIAQEGKGLQAAIDKILREGENRKKKYHEEFEKNAQEMSVRFANSELVKEIIDWMMAGLSRQIDTADRGSHIKEINVPFEFTVCKDAVLCSLGEYDFQKRRCQSLDQPLEQAGLSRAIAAGLQLEIIMKYPKDISGTKVSIRIEQTYQSGEKTSSAYEKSYDTVDCPKTIIAYQAENGYYKDLRRW